MQLKRISHLHGKVDDLRIFNAGVPWVYIIVVHNKKAVYVGETGAIGGGLMSRMSNHLSGNINADLPKKLYDFFGLKKIPPPISIIGINLPGIDDSYFTARHIREACEALISQGVVLENKGWRVVSTARPNSATYSVKIVREVCDAAVEVFRETMRFIEIGDDNYDFNIFIFKTFD